MLRFSTFKRVVVTTARKSLVGFSLSASFALFPATVNLLPTTASGTPSTLADGEVRCEQCEYWWEGTPGSGGVIYFYLKHQFIGECSASRTVAYTPAEGGGEGETGSYCARCNGTSTCHTSPADGMCHIACGSGGGDEVRLLERQRAKALIHTADVRAIAAFLQTATAVVYNSARHTLQVVGCDSAIVDNIELGTTMYLELEKAIAASGV